jgi:hypothetical protein
MSIFSDDIKLSDPNGQKLQGKSMYQNMHRLLRGISSIAVRNNSEVSARFFYDEARCAIRAKVSAKVQLTGGGAFGPQQPMHLDVVSYYFMDTVTGKVAHHVVERVELDGHSIDPFHVLAHDKDMVIDFLIGGRARPGLSVPAGGGGGYEGRAPVKERDTVGALMKVEKQKLDVYGNIVAPSRDSEEGNVRNADGAVRKERKGLFDWIQWKKPEQCEEDWECPEMLRCCNLGFANVCCGGGIGVSAEPAQPVMVPIPIRADDGYPRSGRY